MSVYKTFISLECLNTIGNSCSSEVASRENAHVHFINKISLPCLDRDGGVVCVGWLGRLQSCLKRANLNTAVDKNDEKSGLENKVLLFRGLQGQFVAFG